jgi:hypothetical protein
MRLHPIIRTISQPLFAILLSLPALAQQPASSIPSTGFAGLDQYRASRISIYTDDFGQLARYREGDAALAPATGEKRVVFLGDSITEYWKLPNYFPGKPYINRGVDGQTTPERALGDSCICQSEQSIRSERLGLIYAKVSHYIAVSVVSRSPQTSSQR